MIVSLASQIERENWNNFVLENKGSIFHLWEWGKIIKESLNYQNVFFISKDKDNVINGILPLFVKKDSSENKLVTLPCTGYNNVLVKNLRVRQILLKAAVSFATKTNKNLELHTTERFNHLPKKLTLKKSILCTFTQKTNCNYQKIFKNKLNKHKRNRLRKLEKMKVEIKKANKTDFAQFYGMYLKMMKKNETASLPKTIFVSAFFSLGQYSLFLKCIHRKKVRAYLWSFVYGDTIYLWRSAYRRNPPTESIYLDALFQKTIKIACTDKSINAVDSGIARCESGLAFFKRHWGFKPKQVYVINSY